MDLRSNPLKQHNITVVEGGFSSFSKSQQLVVPFYGSENIIVHYEYLGNQVQCSGGPGVGTKGANTLGTGLGGAGTYPPPFLHLSEGRSIKKPLCFAAFHSSDGWRNGVPLQPFSIASFLHVLKGWSSTKPLGFAMLHSSDTWRNRVWQANQPACFQVKFKVLVVIFTVLSLRVWLLPICPLTTTIMPKIFREGLSGCYCHSQQLGNRDIVPSLWWHHDCRNPSLMIEEFSSSLRCSGRERNILILFDFSVEIGQVYYDLVFCCFYCYLLLMSAFMSTFYCCFYYLCLLLPFAILLLLYHFLGA